MSIKSDGVVVLLLNLPTELSMDGIIGEHVDLQGREAAYV